MSNSEYLIIPFTARIRTNDGANEAAAQMQSIINSYQNTKWEYMRMDTIETVKSDPGCFGYSIGAKAATKTSYNVLVFRSDK